MKLLTIALITLLAITSCTVIKTNEFSVYDFHPSGDAIDVSVTKADGTTIDAVRSQGSSADVITATGDAVKPSLLP